MAPSARPRPSARAGRPWRHPELPVLRSSSIAAGQVCVQKYLEDGRDWRKVLPKEVLQQMLALDLPGRRASGPELAGAAAPARRREGLMAAVATGILQAVDQGFYWSCSGEKQAVPRPMSRLVRLPDTFEVQGEVSGSVASGLAVEVCREAASRQDKPRVALVRFSAERAVTKHLGTDPLLLRSTYLKALFDMERQIHSELALVEDDHVIYTSDVCLLRGPLEEGSPWLSPERIDVVWAKVQRSPRLDEKHYMDKADEASMSRLFGQLVALAVQRGVSVLVVPPVGCEAWHPAISGSLLREKCRGVEVIFCREKQDQFYGRWQEFTSAFLHGIHEEEPEEPGPEELMSEPEFAKWWQRGLCETGFDPLRKHLAKLLGLSFRQLGLVCDSAILGPKSSWDTSRPLVAVVRQHVQLDEADHGRFLQAANDGLEEKVSEFLEMPCQPDVEDKIRSAAAFVESDCGQWRARRLLLLRGANLPRAKRRKLWVSG
ncbi:unnamed protein product [Effrenium voratum]|nr:unnamed protein product [Effrenium voratum]